MINKKSRNSRNKIDKYISSIYSKQLPIITGVVIVTIAGGVYYCHILDDEYLGMMGNLEII